MTLSKTPSPQGGEWPTCKIGPLASKSPEQEPPFQTLLRLGSRHPQGGGPGTAVKACSAHGSVQSGSVRKAGTREAAALTLPGRGWLRMSLRPDGDSLEARQRHARITARLQGTGSVRCTGGQLPGPPEGRRWRPPPGSRGPRRTHWKPRFPIARGARLSADPAVCSPWSVFRALLTPGGGKRKNGI